jgi:competence protein ComGF
MEDRNRFVEKRYERGYTLIETILTFTLFLTLVSLLPGLFHVLFSVDRSPLHQQEISIFFEQADKEIQGSISAEIKSNTLYLNQPNGKLVSYEQYGNRMVRKVDGKGFEIILQNIESVEFALSQTMVSMKVVSEESMFTHKSLLVQQLVNP